MSYTALIRDAYSGSFLAFSNPSSLIRAEGNEELDKALFEIAALEKSGKWLVGFIAYDNFRPEVYTPRLLFYVFDECHELNHLPKSQSEFYLGLAKPDLTIDDYKIRIDSIKEQLKIGNSYQVNFTFQLESEFRGSGFDCFLEMFNIQPTKYAAYIKFDDISVCSISPELFFQRHESKVTVKPMKGTAARAINKVEDEANREKLQNSIKDSAENVMIVDMLRNDLTTISEGSSVKVESLFDIEALPHVWQMTSTITAICNKSNAEILRSLFPSASITGAPKKKTQEIIYSSELGGRGIYTGAIGFISPFNIKRSQFNVAIRTLLIQHSCNRAYYGVGSGITWDSKVNLEYQECLNKALVLPENQNKLQLFETILWQSKSGYYLLNEHLARLEKSATCFNYPFSRDQISEKLQTASADFIGDTIRVRLLLDNYGHIQVEYSELKPLPDKYKLQLACHPISKENLFLRHKTTHRKVYQDIRSECPEADDVILWNEDELITETTIGNLAYRLGNLWYTPPVESGLLNGVYRQHLIQKGSLIERNLAKSDLKTVDEIAMINSLRGWVAAILIHP